MRKRSLKELLFLNDSSGHEEDVREPIEVDLTPMNRDDLSNYATSLVKLTVTLAHEDGQHKTIMAAAKAIEVANSVMKDIKLERIEEERAKNAANGEDGAKGGAVLIDTCDLIKLMHASRAVEE